MTTPDPLASMSPEELIAAIERGLDDDERAARDAGDETTKWYLSTEDNLLEEPGSPVAIGPWGAGIIPEGEHLARHDPSRVLADVESKREILTLHPYTTQRRSVGEGRLAAMYGRNWEKRLKNLDTPYCETCHVEDGVINGGGPCDTLIALARPYLDQETP